MLTEPLITTQLYYVNNLSKFIIRLLLTKGVKYLHFLLIITHLGTNILNDFLSSSDSNNSFVGGISKNNEKWMKNKKNGFFQ